MYLWRLSMGSSTSIWFHLIVKFNKLLSIYLVSHIIHISLYFPLSLSKLRLIFSFYIFLHLFQFACQFLSCIWLYVHIVFIYWEFNIRTLFRETKLWNCVYETVVGDAFMKIEGVCVSVFEDVEPVHMFSTAVCYLSIFSKGSVADNIFEYRWTRQVNSVTYRCMASKTTRAQWAN